MANTNDDYVTIKIKKSTHKLLKQFSATSEKKMVDIGDAAIRFYILAMSRTHKTTLVRKTEEELQDYG